VTVRLGPDGKIIAPGREHPGRPIGPQKSSEFVTNLPEPRGKPRSAAYGHLIERATRAHSNREQRNMQGTVKFFNSEKGYGFISREGGNDVFVHHTSIVGTGFKNLAEGQTVEFEIGQGRKGDEAQNVRVV
jgi:CspA family cold shock protein